MNPPDLYTPAILDHAKNPRHRGPLPDATHTGEGHNPNCGDRIAVRLRVDGVVQAVAWEGDGCSIMVASASMMADLQLPTLGFWSSAAVLWGAAPWDSVLTPGMRSVADFPTRHRCAALPWDALRDALKPSD